MIRENVERIKKEIGSATLVAITKGRSLDEVREAIQAGVNEIGENRLQEAEKKYPYLVGVRKHFVGKVQSNKVNKIVKLFDVIQSIDSVRIAKKISESAKKEMKIMDCFIEVNIGLEKSKFGFAPDEVEKAYAEIKNLPNLNFRGLMCIAPLGKPPRPYFIRLRELANKIGLKELSMGMTDDYKVAIEEGSTMVRIGRGIFEIMEKKEVNITHIPLKFPF